VASLLFDYAAIEASERTLESAKSLMQMAVEYGYPADRVRPLLKLYDQKIASRKKGQYMGYGLVAVVLFALLCGLWRGVRFVFSALLGSDSKR
jgi:asparagine N-glycosylation enzyme membrane subunit Stt3